MMYKACLTRHGQRIVLLLTRQNLMSACHSLFLKSGRTLSDHVRCVSSPLRARWRTGQSVNVMAKRPFPPVTCMVMQHASESTGLLQFYISEKNRNRTITTLWSVEELLEFYDLCRNEASLVNRITILHQIAKLVHRFRGEREVLEKEMEYSQDSLFRDLLNYISDNIVSCTPQGLANTLWALGKIQLTDHELVKISEEEILMHDIAVFHVAEVCQIVHGCAALNLKQSKVLKWVEDGILKRTIQLHSCENRQVAGILSGFIKTGFGSDDFFKCMENEIVSRPFPSFTNGHLVQFALAFAKKGICSDELFDKIEDELARRGLVNVKRTELVTILWAFAKIGKGSQNLFTALQETIIKEGIENLNTSALLWIVWSLAKAGVKSCSVFSLVEIKLCKQGLSKLSNHELVFWLYSFVSGEICRPDFSESVEKELLSRNIALFDNLQIAQMAWSLARGGILNQQLFYSLESEIMNRNFTETQAAMILQGFTNANHESQQLRSHLQTFK